MLAGRCELLELLWIAGSQAPLDRWDSRQAVLAEVLGSHLRWQVDDVAVPEGPAESRRDPRGQLGVVVGRGAALDDREGRLLGRSRRRRFGLGDALDGGEDVLPDLLLVGADGDLQLHLVRDDVVLVAAVNRAHRDDRRVLRVLLAGADRLQRQDRAGGDHYWVDGRLRRGAVAALAVDRQVDRVGAREGVARGDAELSGR